MSVQSAAAILSDLRDQREAAETEAKRLQEAETQAEMDLFHEMSEAGISSFKSDELGKQFVRVTNRYPRLADKLREDDMLAWLRNIGHGGVIREQINPSTLKATLRSIAEEGVTMPEYIEIFEKDAVQVKRSAK